MYNVVYIHTHDSGRCFSPFGYRDLDTPNLADFSTKAHVFEQAFAVAPTCSPSRASLFTSQYPHQNGMLGLCNRGFKIKDYDGHLIRHLNRQQIETVLCGVQHEAAHFKDPFKGGSLIGYQKNLTTETKLADIKDKREWDAQNTENFCGWLENRQSDSPFFTSFGFFGTHRPYPENEKPSNKGVPLGFPKEEPVLADFSEFNESVKHVDNCFGRIMETLASNGYGENTIVVFSTDHGIAYPFGKSFLSDMGLGVALMIKIPGEKANAYHDALVSHLDFVPTICDYLGIPSPKGIEGRSIKPIIDKQAKKIRNELFFEMNFHTSYEPARAIRTERYKYIAFLDDWEKLNLSNINDSKVKSFYMDHGLEKLKKDKEQLYDLYYDPEEKHNLINDPNYLEIKEGLARRLQEWRRDSGDFEDINDLKWEKEWIVNKRESITPSSKIPADYEQGFEPS